MLHKSVCLRLLLTNSQEIVGEPGENDESEQWYYTNMSRKTDTIIQTSLAANIEIQPYNLFAGHSVRHKPHHHGTKNIISLMSDVLDS